MGWWYDMGPNESHNYELYCDRHHVEAEAGRSSGYVKMPEYRWGISCSRVMKNRSEFRIHKDRRLGKKCQVNIARL